MKRPFMKMTAFALFLCAGTLMAQKQTESPTTAEIRQEFYSITNNIRKAVDKMPESDYDFRPAAGMRTFRELTAHIADVQIGTCGAVFSQRKGKFGTVTKTMNKADLVKAMGTSFTECYMAFSELSAQDADAMITVEGHQHTRLGALTMILTHNAEEYGYMAVYLRLKGIVPPSSSDPSPSMVKEVKETKK